jgi:hypothetical protein
MVLLKRLMKITPPKMEELLEMMMTMVSPLREGSSTGEICPPEGKSAFAQVPP